MAARDQQGSGSDRLGKLDEIGEAEVRVLAKSRVRRRLDLKNHPAPERNSPEAEEPTAQKIGWVDVPGTILLEWKANPWKARPKRLTFFSFCLIALYLLSIWLLPGNVIMMVVVPIILVSSASSHLMPSNYVITDEGIYWNNYLNMMFKAWIVIEGFAFDDEMAELFFDTKSVRNRIQRSVPLYYNDNRQEVEALVRQCHGEKWEQLRREVLSRRASVAAAQEAQETKEGE